MIYGERTTSVFQNRAKASVIDHITRPVLLAQTTGYLGQTPGLGLGFVEYTIQINHWLKAVRSHLHETTLTGSLLEDDFHLIEQLIAETEQLIQEYAYEGLSAERAPESLAHCYTILKKRDTAAKHDYAELLVTGAWTLDRVAAEAINELESLEVEYLGLRFTADVIAPPRSPEFWVAKGEQASFNIFLTKAKEEVLNLFVISILDSPAT